MASNSFSIARVLLAIYTDDKGGTSARASVYRTAEDRQAMVDLTHAQAANLPIKAFTFATDVAHGLASLPTLLKPTEQRTK